MLWITCKLDKKYGGVYGIAVRLSPSDTSAFVTKNNLNHKNIKSISDWKSIGDDFYPLYWGKDSRLGSRIYAHLNKYKGTGAANLCKHKELQGKEVIFGICICNDYEKGEKNLHRAFPALYTKSTAGA